MNLNELLINPGKRRGKGCVRDKNYIVTEMGPPLIPTMQTKKKSTPSSDLNWGKSHISVTSSSSVHKSGGSSKMSFEEDAKVIIALTEGRGEARGEVGIAAINVSKPVLILCQISDTQSYINTLTKINIFNPQEILVPVTFIDSFSGNRLIEAVKKHFPGLKYVGCPRNSFNRNNGRDTLSKLCIPSLNAVMLILEHRYYALAAASALITYIQNKLFVFYAAGSVKIEYQESEGYAIIDVSTADRLELVCSTKPDLRIKNSSLYGVLNHCVTKIGSRTLRSFILQPPFKKEYIEERLDAVAEFIRHPEMLLSIQALLQKVPNIDQVLSIATLIPDDPQRCSNRQLNYILVMNTLIDLIEPLKDVVSKSSHPLFARLAETLASKEFAAIKGAVRNVIQDYAHPAKGQAAIMQRCFAIKAGVNGLLDLVRKTFSERLEDMKEYVKRLAEKYDLPLTLGNNQTKGYHIVLTLNQNQKRYMKKSDLPEEFIEVYRLAGSFTMKTPEIVNLSTRLDDILSDILRISNVMVHSLIVEIKKYIPLFYKLCEEIAYLDVLQSLAECSLKNGYVRPKFDDFTEVTFSHHPLLDFLLPTKPVPNDIQCSRDYNVHIITGPNGSGKSIFMRQVMLLQIMAQVGCYVPAQTATFRPADRMYARIFLEDNMEYGASTFVLEMKEIKYIMTTMTQHSLVIIDEPCRSTSVEEGTALAIAIIEKLAQSSAFIYIATHFTLLTKLYDMYLNVTVLQLETIPSGEDPKTFKLDFKYNLIPGVTSVKRYGVYIVRNIWPDSILEYVDALLDKISKKPKDPNITPLDAKVRLKYKFESHFRKLKSQHKLSVSEINKLLNQYQTELEKLGYYINVVPLLHSGEMPRMEHSIFGDIQNADEDLYINTTYMREQFNRESPVSNRISTNIQKTQKGIVEIITPDASRDNQSLNMSTNCPNISFYKNYQIKFTENNHAIYSDCTANQNSDIGYENISQFIAENPENIKMLIPEVNLNSENLSQLSYAKQTKSASLDISTDMDDFRFALPLKNDLIRTSTPLTYEGQKQFTSQVEYMPNLENNASKSPRVNNSFSFRLSQDDVNKDLNSLQDKLEACSQIDWEEREHFDEEYLNTSSPKRNSQLEEQCQKHPKERHFDEEYLNTSSPKRNSQLEEQCQKHPKERHFDEEYLNTSSPKRNSQLEEQCQKHPKERHFDEEYLNTSSPRRNSQLEEQCQKHPKERHFDEEYLNTSSPKRNSQLEEQCQKHPKERHQHIIPIVTVIEGPNDKSLSISECDDIPESSRVHEEAKKETTAKIIIISDIMIAQGKTDTKQEKPVTRQPGLIQDQGTVIEINAADEVNNFNFLSNSHANQSYSGNAYSLTEKNEKESYERIYKDFDSTFNAAESCTDYNSLQHHSESFKSFIDESRSTIKSCQSSADGKLNRDELNLNKSHGVSSGYEVTVIDDPKNFVTSSSTNQTINQENHFTLNGETKQPTYQDPGQMESTSISYASKIRKLSIDSSPQDDSSKKTVTNMSEASNRRDLDEASYGSTSTFGNVNNKTEDNVNLEKRSDVKECSESNSIEKMQKKVNVRNSSIAASSKTKMKPNKTAIKTKKFVPPRKLSVREIKEEFQVQDRKMLESSPTSSNFSKYLQQFITRPTVKQVRNATHLMIIRKTEEGVEVIPAESPRKKKKITPLNRHCSNESFSVKIFSDANALPFENYLNSNKKDYRAFCFDYKNKNLGTQQKFKFQPTTVSLGEYTNNSVTERFVRTPSSQTLHSQQNGNQFGSSEKEENITFTLSQHGINQTLTPDGYYKQNKEDIDRIMSKYLQRDSQEFKPSGIVDKRTNIFENNDLDENDLNI